VIIRPQDFYILAVKLFILIACVPALVGFIGGLFKLSGRKAFMLGAGWWMLVEIAVVIERKSIFFWRELLWITSEYYRPTLEFIIGIVGLVFSFMLAGTAARAFAKLGNNLVGAKPAKARARVKSK